MHFLCSMSIRSNYGVVIEISSFETIHGINWRVWNGISRQFRLRETTLEKLDFWYSNNFPLAKIKYKFHLNENAPKQSTTKKNCLEHKEMLHCFQLTVRKPFLSIERWNLCWESGKVSRLLGDAFSSSFIFSIKLLWLIFNILAMLKIISRWKDRNV